MQRNAKRLAFFPERGMRVSASEGTREADHACSPGMSGHETEKPHAANRTGICGRAFKRKTIRSGSLPKANRIKKKLLDMKYLN